MTDPTAIFESHRCHLEGLAYRMLGTLADAQDVVQETYLKWSRADHGNIRDAKAWLVTVCSRLAMDVLKSARARRESYFGTWLPEPFIDEHADTPADQLRVDDTVSFALMLALEKLSPAERAAFLLHEVFGYRFTEIAGILEKSPAACRQLAARARIAVRSARPRFKASPEEHQRLLTAFFKAAHAGDLRQLKTVLAASVELHADGGGKADTAVDVVHGAGRVIQFFVRVLARREGGQTEPEVVVRWFNGVPGILLRENGQWIVALSVAIRDQAICRIYALRNPDKLAAFGP